MNIEELKLLLESINTLGQTGAIAFGLFLLKDLLYVAVVGLTVVFSLKLLFAFIREIVGMFSFAYDVITAMGYSWNRLTGEYASDHERTEVITRIHEFRKEQK